MHFAASYDALVPLPVFQALKAFSLAAMAFSAYSFHHQVSRLRVRPSCAIHLLSCLELASLDVVPDILNGSISYSCRCTDLSVEDLLEMIACLRIVKLPNLRRGMNLRLDCGGRSVLMSHSRSWCCRAASLPGITVTSVTSLRMVLRKRMKSICMTTFPDLDIMRWLSLRDSVSTTSQTLPLRVFTLSVPTLNFLRCLLDSP